MASRFPQLTTTAAVDRELALLNEVLDAMSADEVERSSIKWYIGELVAHRKLLMRTGTGPEAPSSDGRPGGLLRLVS